MGRGRREMKGGHLWNNKIQNSEDLVALLRTGLWFVPWWICVGFKFKNISLDEMQGLD